MYGSYVLVFSNPTDDDKTNKLIYIKLFTLKNNLIRKEKIKSYRLGKSQYKEVFHYLCIVGILSQDAVQLRILRVIYFQNVVSGDI